MSEIANLTVPVTLTDGAVTELKKVMESEDLDNSYALRVGVKGGGCSGFSYILGFDTPHENDEKFESNGLPIIMDKAHAIYLVGIQIDFVNGLENRGFVFSNPNAKETCGCGTSFSA